VIGGDCGTPLASVLGGGGGRRPAGGRDRRVGR
jgi:hypothetical protein